MLAGTTFRNTDLESYFFINHLQLNYISFTVTIIKPRNLTASLVIHIVEGIEDGFEHGREDIITERGLIKF